MKTRLQIAREEKTPYTQDQAAPLLGVSVSALRNYEQGKNDPQGEFYKRAAKLYGVPCNYLLYLDEPADEDEMAAMYERIVLLPREVQERVIHYIELEETKVKHISGGWGVN